MLRQGNQNIPVGASTSAPTVPLTPLRRPWRRRAVQLRVLLVGCAVTAGIWGIINGPWYQEYRLSHLSFTTLNHDARYHLADARWFYWLGVRLNERQQYTLADPALRHACELDPDNPRLRDEWTRALLGSGLTTAAFDQLKQFVGTHPDLAAAHLVLGKFYVTQNSMIRASEELQSAVKLQQDNGEAWSYLAGAENAIGHLEPAKQAAERAVALRPNSAQDHFVLALLMVQANQPQRARQEFVRAAALGPRLATIHREYAAWLSGGSGDTQDRQLAVAEALRAAALDPSDAHSQLILGRALALNGAAKEAVAPLEYAAEIASGDPVPALTLAQVYRTLKNTPQADRWQHIYVQRQRIVSQRCSLWEAVRVHPTDAVLQKRLARLFGLEGDVGECLSHYATALHHPLDAPQVLIAAANDLADGHHGVEALPLAKRAVLIAPANPDAIEAMGNVELALGHVDAANEQYKRAVQWMPDRQPAIRKHVTAYYAERAAHPSEAELAYRQARRQMQTQIGPKHATQAVSDLVERAVTLEPDNPSYLQLLLQLQIMRKQNEEAIKTAYHVLKFIPDDPIVNAVLAVALVDRANTPQDYREVEVHLKKAATDPAVTTTYNYAMGVLALRRHQGAAAVRYLRYAIARDPASEVAYYKLSRAEMMVGDRAASERAMTAFSKRNSQMRKEMIVLGDITQHPEEPDRYRRAIKFYEAAGKSRQATAVRAAALDRFGKTFKESIDP